MAEYVDKGAKVTKYDIARKILKEKLAHCCRILDITPACILSPRIRSYVSDGPLWTRVNMLRPSTAAGPAQGSDVSVQGAA